MTPLAAFATAFGVTLTVASAVSLYVWFHRDPCSPAVSPSRRRDCRGVVPPDVTASSPAAVPAHGSGDGGRSERRGTVLPPPNHLHVPDGLRVKEIVPLVQVPAAVVRSGEWGRTVVLGVDSDGRLVPLRPNSNPAGGYAVAVLQNHAWLS